MQTTYELLDKCARLRKKIEEMRDGYGKQIWDGEESKWVEPYHADVKDFDDALDAEDNKAVAEVYATDAKDVEVKKPRRRRKAKAKAKRKPRPKKMSAAEREGREAESKIGESLRIRRAPIAGGW